MCSLYGSVTDSLIKLSHAENQNNEKKINVIAYW